MFLRLTIALLMMAGNDARSAHLNIKGRKKLDSIQYIHDALFRQCPACQIFPSKNSNIYRDLKFYKFTCKNRCITVGKVDGFFLSGVELNRLWEVGLLFSARRHSEAAGDPAKMLSRSAAKSALTVVGRKFQGRTPSSPTVLSC
jgi:hypothetical protein